MTSDWPRPLVHWSIVAVDVDTQRSFYSQLFNWTIGDGPFMSIEVGIGAPEGGPAGHIQAGAVPGVSLYVQVRDLQTSLNLAIELGGKEVMAPFDLPNGQTLAAIEDPEGNFLMLVQQ
ncbi:MAG TPA: VOC family protein [Acidimicrobiales bacterium]